MPEQTLSPLVSITALPFVAALLASFMPSSAKTAVAWLAGLTAAACLAMAISLYTGIADGAAISTRIAWLPSLGLNFVVRLDGFAWMFVMLISGMGVLVVLYARYYMSPSDAVTRFYAFLLGFMGSMLGVVLAGNLLQLVFFWELTSLFSFLLIGYWYRNPAARDGARIALTVTATGGLALLGGVTILGQIAGSYELDIVLAAGDRVRNHALYLPMLLLILLGALTKSAQFPFHFWLPQAMAAPTPVSAYLHSATMVKAGVFLLARLWPVLAGTDVWFWIVGTGGLATFLIGAFLAAYHQDLKGLLAYSTISHLGLITLMLGIGTPLGAVAAIFHMANHATFKASLFMAAGIIDHETGTRDIRRLSGLIHVMPITVTLATVAAAAMAGVPLLNGFLSKEIFFGETVETLVDSPLDKLLPYVVTLAAAISVAYSLRLIHQVFLGSTASDLPRTPGEPPVWMIVPVALLVLACLAVGVLPALTIGPFLASAVQSVLGARTPAYSLSVWHGFTPALIMSIAALIGGILLYLAMRRYLRGDRVNPVLHRLSTRRLFDRVMVALSWTLARRAAALMGTQRLQPQLRLVICLAFGAGLWALYRSGVTINLAGLQDVNPAFMLLWTIGIICAVAAAQQAKFHRLAAMALMGGAGLVVCITFAWLQAPDLALTQLLVEIVTTVLLLLGLRWLPKRLEDAGQAAPVRLAARARRVRDLIIAVGAGLIAAAISYAVMVRPAPDTIASFFVERAYTEGGGTNIVNVILVDFRGFDTLGEITVLAAVALTVYALLRRYRPAPDSIRQSSAAETPEVTCHEDESGRQAEMLLVPGLIMRLMFPFVAALALYLFLRGHDLPGGGFVAGLVMAVGFILQYMSQGARWVESRLSIRPVLWIGLGLFLSGATGIGAAVFGHPFLTSYSTYADIPLLGRIPLATALLFDLGVFLLVVGTTALMLIALAHQSLRSHRSAPPPPDPAAL
ncbi:MAG: monovalent cation/H+ antiporter subunit A [Sphingomonadales bacterium]